MKNFKMFGTSSMIAAVLFATAGTAAAKGAWAEIEREINSCVAVVAEHANYTGADHVRHAVVDVKERTVGYKLTIQTSIYSDAADTLIREYATSCTVNGSHTPMKFEISESFDNG